MVATCTNATSNKANVNPSSQKRPKPEPVGALDVHAIVVAGDLTRVLGGLGLMCAEELVDCCTESLTDGRDGPR